MEKIIEFMKRNYKVVLIIAALSAVLWSFMPTKKVADDDKDKVLLELLSFVLEKGHYAPIEINDDFSKKAYAAYIASIDPTKRYFTQQDINEFSKYELRIDDIVKDKDLTFFDLTYNRLMKRMAESKTIYTNLLAKPMDFNADETLNVDYEKLPYAANEVELQNRWKKILKLTLLSTITDKEKLEEEKKSKEANYQVVPFSKLEEEARKSTKNNLDNNYSFIAELTREDWFSMFLNAIVTQYDPHTFYFSPEDKDKFDVSMSGKFEGIGARLSKKNDAVEIVELISGGPAWRGKQLEAGDVILKVAQGNDEPVDISGMRLDDVIKKIKGPKGTIVKLTVKKVDGTIKVITITRDEVETEETFAKSSVVEKNGKKFGIIYLPKFYISFENKQKRDAYKDVAQEIERLKEAKVEGIIVDLRDNGGGSLETVVKMVGLFIEKGPVVQVKAAGRKPEVLPDPDPQVQWTGPLVVMVNNYSASASEIFAAAIQDYKRGIIIGSKQTYGKGTVQNVFELNQFLRTNKFGDLGALKATTQKFYRINGGSTQLEGVKSDIVVPDRFAFIETGERDEKNAMAWDKIEPAPYAPVTTGFDLQIAKSRNRIASNTQFKLIEENAKWINDRKEDNIVHLRYSDYKQEMADLDKQTTKFKAIQEYKNGLVFNSLPYEQELFKTDDLLKLKRERWHDDMQKDIYVEESLNVLNDLTVKDLKDMVKNNKKRKTKEITAVK
ncbi:carboxy terminal-processing peptidase [Flavobacterium sp.]|uniref:carboxy terminal-processing peptidase n=1 Tax=Flavobacterium sp. TaxID=239 RepID=UPI0025C0A069|nr:carboxy terminal-processing peptidase [Flavobacterium sp.]